MSVLKYVWMRMSLSVYQHGFPGFRCSLGKFSLAMLALRDQTVTTAAAGPVYDADPQMMLFLSTAVA